MTFRGGTANVLPHKTSDGRGMQGLSLVLRADADRIFVLLTDHEALALQSWAPCSLDALLAARANGSTSFDWRARVLPPDVAEALDEAGDVPLTLLVSEELDWLPLESMGGGRGGLVHHCAPVRHLAGGTRPAAGPAPPAIGASPLHVCVIARHGEPWIHPATAEWPWQVSAPAWTPDLTQAPADLLQLTCRSQVLVCPNGGDCSPALIDALARNDGLPAVSVWPAMADDIAIVRQLQRQRRAALIAPADVQGPALLGALTPWLLSLAGGETAARALRRLPDAGRWRLYHAPPLPLCQAETAPALAASDLGDDQRLVVLLSFDLVDSTRQLDVLGSEAYSDMLLRLHERSVECVERHGGSVEPRRGDDSAMACFGWPHALEDAALRALDAALALQATIADMPGQPQFRMGVACGRVTVRDGVPFGPAVHLAARLRAQAAPGQIVVDKPTEAAARRRFLFEVHPLHGPLKGIDSEVQASRLFGRASGLANDDRAATRLVGREVELAELQQRWREACQGTPVYLLLHGEAGVGKSRLVRELLAGIGAEGGRSLVLRGLPETQGSALQTLGDALRQRLGLRHDDPLPAQRALVAAALPPEADGAGMLDTLMHLLAPQAVGAQPVDGLTPGAARERLLGAAADTIVAGATTAPLALVVEDLQWVDPSTRELLERIVTTPRPARLLLLATRRDEGDLAADGAATLPGAETMQLGRLSVAASRWLVRECTGDALPRDLVQRIAERAGGVPLFLEESARLALEVGAGAASAVDEVPTSLDALLMARLDRVGLPAKRLAQACAVLGREFPLALLQRLVDDEALPWPLVTDGGIDTRMAPLLHAHLLRRFETNGRAWLGFCHELQRDMAYLSLLQRDRQRLHAAAVRALRAQGAPPHQLAHHLAGAGAHAEAVPLWEEAARQSVASASEREAVAHLEAALRSLAQVPRSVAHARAELRLQLQLARRLIAAEGYGADGVERAYDRASALVDELGDNAARIKVLLGLESLHVMRGELERAEMLAQQALVGAQAANDVPTRLQARWALAHVRFHAGDSVGALALMQHCLDEYAAVPTHRDVVQDPGVMCLCYSAWGLWEQGQADTARDRTARALQIAQTLGHRFSLAEACGFAASVALFRGEVQAGSAWADQAVALCEEQGYKVWLAHARVVRGRLVALAGDTEGGLREMTTGYAQWVATGAGITRAMYLSLMAETRLANGDLDGAAHDLDEAFDIAARTGERYHEAELLRLRGELACARSRQAECVALLRQALATASAQGKRAFVLRAAIPLARVLAERGQRDEGVALLSGALADIDQGLETRDPRRARALLDTLGGRHGQEETPIAVTDTGPTRHTAC